MKDRPGKNENSVEMVWPEEVRFEDSENLKNGQWRFLRPDLLVRVFVLLVAVQRYSEEGIDITDGGEMPTFRMNRNSRYEFNPGFLRSELGRDGKMTFWCTLSTLRVTMYCSLGSASCHLQFDNERPEPVVVPKRPFGRTKACGKIKRKLKDIHNSRPITEAPPTSGNTQGGPTSPVAAAEDDMTDGEFAEPTEENRNVTNDVPLPNSDVLGFHNVGPTENGMTHGVYIEPTDDNHSMGEEHPFATLDDLEDIHNLEYLIVDLAEDGMTDEEF